VLTPLTPDFSQVFARSEAQGNCFNSFIRRLPL
jgi:hypothetical protein